MSGRHARTARAPGLGEAELAALQSATVAVIGAGVLGGQVAQHLALLGVGLLLVDPGLVEIENLGNQAFPVAALGQPKAAVRARQLAALNPDASLRVLVARLEELGAGELAGAGAVVVTVDNRATRVHVAELCHTLGIAMVDAALDGSGRWLVGTVTAYDPRSAGSACYLCGRSDEPLADRSREAVPAPGDGCPSWRDAGRAPAPPTLQASALGAVVAGWQAMVTVRLLLGQGGGHVGRRTLIDAGADLGVRTFDVPQDPRCVLGHGTQPPLLASAASGPAALAEEAGDRLGASVSELGLPRLLAFGLRCPSCGAADERVRVATAWRDDEVSCRACDGVARVPVELGDALSLAALRALDGVTWAELGVPPLEVVRVRTRRGDGAHRFVVNPGAPRSALGGLVA